jgi:prolyl 4-hydroxylase
MHHSKVSNNYDWLPHNVDPSIPTPEEYKDMTVQPLGDRQKVYEDMIQGCVDHYGDKGSRCIRNERDRIDMSLTQPEGMVNYTKYGYTKIRAPDDVFQLIKAFWEQNKDKQSIESWPAGNTYVNHWDIPTYFTSVEDPKMKGGGYVLKQKIWNAARDTISEWMGQQLAECSLYGIRIYKENAVLAPHVDRLPLVASAIINVDQDVDEPWPLEVIGHDGIAKNITMVPGDLVLYESHSILHGRPFPLKGRFMANVFVHFEPIGPVGEEIAVSSDLPNYVLRGSEEEKHWKRKNPSGYKLHHAAGVAPGSTLLHKVALSGDHEEVKRLLKEKVHLVNVRDVNGWTPLHEAVRNGDVDIVQALLDHGADINARTQGNEAGASGGTPLWWALKYHDEDKGVVGLLKANGAKNIAPTHKVKE